ncbi:hypothetical protein V8E51_014002 [Hyaloscypha variabilis]
MDSTDIPSTAGEPEIASNGEPKFFAELGKVACEAEKDCDHCKQQAGNIRNTKKAIMRILEKHERLLDDHYLRSCEEMLRKKVTPAAGAECNKCETASNEKRQATRIERFTRISFNRDGTYHRQQMHGLDEFPNMEGTLVEGPALQLSAAKQSVSSLENEVAALVSERDQFLSQAEEAKKEIRSAKQRADDAEAHARQLKTSLAMQEKSLTDARKTAELDTYEIEKSAKTILRTEAKVRKAEEEARPLRAQLAEQKESSEAALHAATTRAENAEHRITELTADFVEVQTSLKLAESKVGSLRAELDQQKELSAKAQDEINRLGRESNEQKDESKLLRQNQVSLQTKLDQMGKSNNDMKAAFEMLQQQLNEMRTAGTMAPVSESAPSSMYHSVPSTMSANVQKSLSIKQTLCLALVLLATFSPLAIILGLGFLYQPSEMTRNMWHQASNQSLHTTEEQTYWPEGKKYAADHTLSVNLPIFSPSASFDEEGTASGPSDPRPHDLPSSFFHKAVGAAFGSPVKVAGWSAACFTVAMVHYRHNLSARV